jgi:hypothetical protein
MKSTGMFLLLSVLLPLIGRASELNLATVTCNKYENEILSSAAPQTADASQTPDSINMVMWLFGYSVAMAGEHVMYGNALTSFGYALDAECKNNPTSSLLQAVTSVTPKHDKPMDLTALTCATFESRHLETTRTDPESATTVMMWLFGYSVGQSGSHLFDPKGAPHFASMLQTRCTEHPDESLFDALVAVNKSSTRH